MLNLGMKQTTQNAFECTFLEGKVRKALECQGLACRSEERLEVLRVLKGSNPFIIIKKFERFKIGYFQKLFQERDDLSFFYFSDLFRFVKR
jgi:hypothetical protein